MNLKEIHDWFDFVTNKAQGEYYSHGDYDNCLDRAQMMLFNEMYSEYATGEKMQDAMAPFKSSYSFLTSNTTNGIVNLPADYLYMTGGHIVVVESSHTKYRPLEIISEDEISWRLNSQLRPATVNKPFATIASKVAGVTTIQLYPTVPMAGSVFYLKRPTPPVFVYTQSGRVVTYDSVNSVQLQWPESEINEIIIRALVYLGVNADDADIVQYANVKSKEIN